jgi:hypothetical protein
MNINVTMPVAAKAAKPAPTFAEVLPKRWQREDEVTAQCSARGWNDDWFDKAVSRIVRRHRKDVAAAVVASSRDALAIVDYLLIEQRRDDVYGADTVNYERLLGALRDFITTGAAASPSAPEDPIFALIEKRRTAHAAVNKYLWEDGTEEDARLTTAYEDAERGLNATRPTTLAGLRAKLAYALYYVDYDPVQLGEPEFIGPLLDNLLPADLERVVAREADADEELVRLGAEFEAAWTNELHVIATTSDDDDESLNTARDASQEIAERIVDLPATSLAGIRVKMMVRRWADGSGGDFDETYQWPGARALRALVRDLDAGPPAPAAAATR